MDQGIAQLTCRKLPDDPDSRRTYARNSVYRAKLIQAKSPLAQSGKIQPSVHDWNGSTRDVHGVNHSTAFLGAS
jgi:hypothetical protein